MNESSSDLLHGPFLMGVFCIFIDEMIEFLRNNNTTKTQTQPQYTHLKKLKRSCLEERLQRKSSV